MSSSDEDDHSQISNPSFSSASFGSDARKFRFMFAILVKKSVFG